MFGEPWEEFLLAGAGMQAKREEDKRPKEKAIVSSRYWITKEWERIPSSQHPQSRKLNRQTSIKWAKINDRA